MALAVHRHLTLVATVLTCFFLLPTSAAKAGFEWFPPAEIETPADVAAPSAAPQRKPLIPEGRHPVARAPNPDRHDGWGEPVSDRPRQEGGMQTLRLSDDTKEKRTDSNSNVHHKVISETDPASTDAIESPELPMEAKAPEPKEQPGRIDLKNLGKDNEDMVARAREMARMQTQGNAIKKSDYADSINENVANSTLATMPTSSTLNKSDKMIAATPNSAIVAQGDQTKRPDQHDLRYIVSEGKTYSSNEVMAIIDEHNKMMAIESSKAAPVAASTYENRPQDRNQRYIVSEKENKPLTPGPGDSKTINSLEMKDTGSSGPATIQTQILDTPKQVAATIQAEILPPETKPQGAGLASTTAWRQDLNLPPSIRQSARGAAPDLSEEPAVTENAATATATPPSTFSQALGFGTDMPLAFAVRQITPSGITHVFDKDINLGMKVSWNGGKPWNEVVTDMIKPHGLYLRIDGNKAYIHKAKNAADQTVSANKTPIPVAGAKTISRLSAPADIDEEKTASAPKDAQYYKDMAAEQSSEDEAEMQMAATQQPHTRTFAARTAPPIDLPATPVRTTASAPENLQQQPPRAWHAYKGQSLRDILLSWSPKANVEISWEATENYRLDDNIIINDTFHNALLSMFEHNLTDNRAPAISYVEPQEDGKSAKLVVRDYSG